MAAAIDAYVHAYLHQYQRATNPFQAKKDMDPGLEDRCESAAENPAMISAISCDLGFIKCLVLNTANPQQWTPVSQHPANFLASAYEFTVQDEEGNNVGTQVNDNAELAKDWKTCTSFYFCNMKFKTINKDRESGNWVFGQANPDQEGIKWACGFMTIGDLKVIISCPLSDIAVKNWQTGEVIPDTVVKAPFTSGQAACSTFCAVYDALKEAFE